MMNSQFPETAAADSGRFWRTAGWILIFALFFYSLYLFLEKKFYYFGSDIFYYLSIADSLEQTGRFLDLTLSPPQSPRTPQNAVVILHYLLAKLFPSAEFRLQILVVLNALALWISVCPLLKIADRAGGSSRTARLALAAVYLGGWHMLQFQLAPINDGLFRTGSLWLIYWLLWVSDRDWGLKELWRGHKGLLACGCLLAAALIHFRLNALVLPLAACLAAAVLRKWKTVWIALLFLALMLGSFGLPYSFAGHSRIQQESQQAWSNVFYHLPGHVWNFAQESLPQALFRNLGTAGNVLYAGFALAMVLAAVEGIRRREFSILIVVLICLGTFGFLLLYYAVPFRMLLMVYPLLYLLILRDRRLRPIGYLFVFAVLMQSFMFFYNGEKKSETVQFWDYVGREVKVSKTNSLLITDRPREAYYFCGLGGLYNHEYEWSDLLGKEAVYVAGKKLFLQQQEQKIRSLAAQNNQSIQSIPLTPAYTDVSGHALLQIKISPE